LRNSHQINGLMENPLTIVNPCSVLLELEHLSEEELKGIIGLFSEIEQFAEFHCENPSNDFARKLIAKFYPSLTIGIARSILFRDAQGVMGKSRIKAIHKRAKKLSSLIMLSVNKHKGSDYPGSKKIRNEPYQRARNKEEFRRANKFSSSMSS